MPQLPGVFMHRRVELVSIRAKRVKVDVRRLAGAAVSWFRWFRLLYVLHFHFNFADVHH